MKLDEGKKGSRVPITDRCAATLSAQKGRAGEVDSCIATSHVLGWTFSTIDCSADPRLRKGIRPAAAAISVARRPQCLADMQ